MPILKAISAAEGSGLACETRANYAFEFAYYSNPEFLLNVPIILSKTAQKLQHINSSKYINACVSIAAACANGLRAQGLLPNHIW